MRHEFLRALTCVVVVAATPGLAQSVPVMQCIQAEDFSAMSGATFDPPEYGEPRASVKACGAGDWVRFDSVSLLDGAYDSVYVNCWTTWEVKEWNVRHWFVPGCSIVVRLDSPTGAIVASVPLTATGMWGYGPSSTMRAPVTRATGIHSLVLTFTGADTVCEIDKFCLVGRATVNPSDARDYYVSTLGSDNGAGDLAHPFKTIQHAASVMKPGSRCLIRQGVYRETVRPACTGLTGAPLTFQAYAGEDVFISGADSLTGWTRSAGNVWKAPMKWSQGRHNDQLLVDGKMAVTARAPNLTEWYTPFADWIGLFPAGLSNWNRWRDSIDQMLIPVLVPYRTNSASSESPLFSVGVSQPGFGVVLPLTLFGKPADFFKGGVFHLYNDFWKSEADIVGSRSPDADHMTLDCSAMSSVRIKGSGNCYVSSCLNLLDAPNEWVRSDSTAYLYPPDGGDPSHHLVEAKRRDQGFDLTGKQFVNLTGIKFLATSVTLADAWDCVLDACEFKYVSHYDAHEWVDNAASAFGSPLNPSDGSRGIYVSGGRNIVKNCLVAVSAAAGIILSGRNQEVTNCRIRDIDYGASYYAGIYIMKRAPTDDDAAAMNINHNTIYNVGRSTINFQGSADSNVPANRHRIQYNDLGRFGWLVSEVTSVGLEGSASRVDVSYNWFHGASGGSVSYFGCDCGWGCWQSWLHHNVFWNAGAINSGTWFDRAAAHWVFCGGDTGATGSLVFNNTVVDSTLLAHRDWDGTGTRFNNIYASGDTVPWKFTEPDHADYSTRQGSPAIDAGVQLPATYAAALGYTPAYGGTAPDLGAYEYGQPRWVAGANWQERPWSYPPVPVGTVSAPRPDGLHGVRALSLRVCRGVILIDAPRVPACRITVHDALGRTVVQRKAEHGGRIALPIRELARGMYMVQVRSGSGVLTRRVSMSQ